MVPLVGNFCTINANSIANGTIGKEIGANGKNGNTIGTNGTNVTNQWYHWENPEHTQRIYIQCVFEQRNGIVDAMTFTTSKHIAESHGLL